MERALGGLNRETPVLSKPQLQDLGPQEQGPSAPPDGPGQGRRDLVGEVTAHVTLTHRNQGDVPAALEGPSPDSGDPLQPPLDAPRIHAVQGRVRPVLEEDPVHRLDVGLGSLLGEPQLPQVQPDVG